MQAILPFLLEQIPSHIAAYGIGRKNPKLGSFIHAAQTAGYSTDAIVGYLRNKFKPTGAALNESNLEQRAIQGTARPDEKAELQQIKSSQFPSNLLQKGAAAGAGALAGLGATRMMGKDSQEIQEQEQPRSFPKVSPMQEEQIEPPIQKPQQGPEGMLEALSPKLKTFIEERLSAGNPLNRIASLAKSNFFDEINQIQNESGMEFRDFLESLYGQKRQTARVIGLQQQEQGAGKQNLSNSIMQAVQMMRQIRGQ